MLTSYDKAYKSLIYVKQGIAPEVPIGYLLDFVINPDTGIFEAIWVQTGKGVWLLALRNIMGWQEDEIYIESADDLVKVGDFPRLKKVLEKEVPILGNKVFMKKTKEYLGRVKDFAFDTISPRILTITVKKGFWIFGSSRIIHHQKISKITGDGIFIFETGLKIEEAKVKLKGVKKLRSGTEVSEN